MGRRTNKIRRFIELEVNRPFSERDGLDLVYHCVDTEEGRRSLKRVYFRLFDEIMAERKKEPVNQLPEDSKITKTL